MWKWVVRDYFEAFTWVRIKECIKQSGFWIVYFGFIIPMTLERFRNNIQGVLCLCIIILFVMLEKTHSVNLPKVLYLCPMTKKMRKSYLERKILFRIVFHTMLGILGSFLFFASGLLDGGMALLCIVDCVCYSVGTCGFDRQPVDAKVRERFHAPAYTSGGWETVCMFVTMISFLFKWMVLEVTWIDIKWVFVAVAILIQFPLTIKLLSNWNQTVERISSYEGSYE